MRMLQTAQQHNFAVKAICSFDNLGSCEAGRVDRFDSHRPITGDILYSISYNSGIETYRSKEESTLIAQPQHLKMSVEAYLALDRESSDTRYEYIDGYAYLLVGGHPSIPSLRPI
jgi:hypothetical protein